ncbi:MAG: FadR family transcriptional regulator [Chloroflexi bacterium]|nr:FadR family transcriptional regulator [Chloroflexota bacterium]
MSNEPQFPMKPVKHRLPLYKVLQQEIKDYIVRNALKPGDQLPSEIELAHQLGVSRNSVREAVKALEMLDIVEGRSGAGLFVGSFSFNALLDSFGYGIMFNLTELSDILEVRFHVEYGMIPRAIEAVTPEQISDLRVIVDQMHSAAQVGSYSAEHDRLFHQTLWANVDNSVVGKILDVFWGIFYQARQQISLPEPRDLMRTYERHARILEALETRDIKTMQESMIFHYEGIKDRLKYIRASHR